MLDNYQDYANDVEMATKKEHAQSDLNRGEQNFPVKLHYMLSELETHGMDHIVSWQPHGRCFLVHKQQQFVEKVLPLWFRQTKFPSFQRQLNLYGFKRLTSGQDKGGYYHECFLRSKCFLSRRIQRIKIKGTGPRKPSSPETEPNFYDAPHLPYTKVPSKNDQVFLFRSMLPSGPSMKLSTGGSLSLQEFLASPTLAAPLQWQAQLPPPPLFHTGWQAQLPPSPRFHTGRAHLMQVHRPPVRPQRFRTAHFHPEMQMVAGFGQPDIPMVSGRQDGSAAAMAWALSRNRRESAGFAGSSTFWRGSRG